MAAHDQEILTHGQIERLYNRVFKFLKGVATTRDICVKLAARGYDPEQHQEALDLLNRLLQVKRSWFLGDLGKERRRAAMEAICEWTSKNLPISEAALEHKHPPQGEHLFHSNLPKKMRADRYFEMKIHLERLKALREGSDPARADSREEDRAAVATLEARGLAGPEVESRLAGLLEQATLSAEDRQGRTEEEDGRYMEAALALRDWFKDWSEAARRLIKDRRHLIRLGLAAPRRRKGAK